MHHAAKAYGAVAQQTASPRDLEAQLLLRAASRLQTIHDDWEGQRGALDHALLFNRKLWTVFLTTSRRTTIIRCRLNCVRTSPISASLL